MVWAVAPATNSRIMPAKVKSDVVRFANILSPQRSGFVRNLSLMSSLGRPKTTLTVVRGEGSSGFPPGVCRWKDFSQKQAGPRRDRSRLLPSSEGNSAGHTYAPRLGYVAQPFSFASKSAG